MYCTCTCGASRLSTRSLPSRPASPPRGAEGAAENWRAHEEGAGKKGEKKSSGGGGGAAPGATLFERMANLSRGGKTVQDDEPDDDDDSAALSIPRFLGRQNNQ